MNVYSKVPGYGRLAIIPVLSKKAKGLPRYNRGDLVQLDTVDIRPLPETVLKQFAARDVICRWDVLDIYRRATSVNAACFLDSVEERMRLLLHLYSYSVRSLPELHFRT